MFKIIQITSQFRDMIIVSTTANQNQPFSKELMIT